MGAHGSHGSSAGGGAHGSGAHGAVVPLTANGAWPGSGGGGGGRDVSAKVVLWFNDDVLMLLVLNGRGAACSAPDGAVVLEKLADEPTGAVVQPVPPALAIEGEGAAVVPLNG